MHAADKLRSVVVRYDSGEDKITDRRSQYYITCMTNETDVIGINEICRSTWIEDILTSQHIRDDTTMTFKLDISLEEYTMFRRWLRNRQVPKDWKSHEKLLDILNMLLIPPMHDLVPEYIFAPNATRSSLGFNLYECFSKRLPADTQLDIVEHLHPPLFDATRDRLGDGCSTYARQLSSLLFNSPFARLNFVDAHETYQNVIAARQTIIKAVRTNDFPMSIVSNIRKVCVAPDHCSYLKVKHAFDGPQLVLEVWSLLQGGIRRIVFEEHICDAGYMETSQLWIAFEDVFRVYALTPHPRLEAEWRTDGRVDLTVSRNFIFAKTVEWKELYRCDEKFTWKDIHIPPDMEFIWWVAFSPGGRLGVFYNWDKISWRDLEQDLAPVAPDYVSEFDIENIIFSLDGRKVAGVGDHQLLIWSCADLEQAPVRFSTKERIIEAILSSDGRFMLLLTKPQPFKSALLILGEFDGELREICCKWCRPPDRTTTKALALFLDRFVFVGQECLDLRNALGRDW